MDFAELIKQFSAAIPGIMKNCQTEEATKTGLIMPFLNILGYNVFNPAEVCPECVADVGTKKGEKVDYAIKKDGKTIMLIECKSVDTDLAHIHMSQLYRYFGVMEAKIGILTNGIKYYFFSDIDESNKMDVKAFFELDMLNLTDNAIEILKQFRKEVFNVEKILPSAIDMKHIKAIKSIFAKDLENPSEDFTKYYASQVYNGRLTKNVVDEFSAVVKKAITQYINEMINDRLKSAMSPEEDVTTTPDTQTTATAEPDKISEKDRVVTTPDEIEGFNIVRAILSKYVSPERVVMRDVISYCGILLDDSNRKPLCRLYFNSDQKRYIGIFNNGNEERIPVNKPTDIFQYSDKLVAGLESLLNSAK